MTAERYPAAGALRTFAQPNRWRLALVVAWSVAMAVLAVQHYLAAPPGTLMDYRAKEIASSIDVLDHGGPPLVVSDVPYHRGLSVSHLQPAGATDDQGIYLYLPLLGTWSGEHDPRRLMVWLFAGCFGLLVLLIPLVVFGLFRSVAAALLAPILVRWKFDWMEPYDLYWIQAWYALFALPALLFAYRLWTEGRRRWATVLLAVLAVAGSFASSIRVNTGLPIAIGAVGIALFAGSRLRSLPRTWRREWRLRGLLVAAVAVGYLSVSTFGFAAVRAYRDSRVHWPAASSLPSQHPFWHPTYLGLGYLPNPYGIAWNDSVAADVVARADPEAPYLSPSYEATLRKAYFHIARTNPGFVLRTYATKARVILADAFLHFHWYAFLLPLLALFERGRRRRLGAAALLSAPTVVLGGLPSVLTIPSPQYELAWLGACGAVWAIALCWGLARLPFIVRLVTTLPSLPRHRAFAGVGVLAAAAACLAAASAHARPGTPIDASSTYTSQATPFATGAAAPGRRLAAWSFTHGLPFGWQRRDAQTVQPDAGDAGRPGLYVLTPMRPAATALQGPGVLLRPGTYHVAAQGRVLAGGLELRVESTPGESVLTSGRYWYEQGNFLTSTLAADFTLYRRTRVRVALDNWTPFPNASAWVLWNVGITRVSASSGEALAYYRANATPLSPAPSAARGSVRDWRFSGTLAPRWSVDGQNELRQAGTSLGVVTTPARFGYQLHGPALRLPAGRYAVAVAGRVLSGGLELGILNEKRDVWIETRHFWAGQPFRPRKDMAAALTLDRPTEVRVILSNWAPTDHPSTWLLRRVTIVRLAA